MPRTGGGRAAIVRALALTVARALGVKAAARSYEKLSRRPYDWDDNDAAASCCTRQP